MATYRICFLDGTQEDINADSYDLTMLPGWVTFKLGTQVVDTLSAGSMKRPPKIIPPVPQQPISPREPRDLETMVTPRIVWSKR